MKTRPRSDSQPQPEDRLTIARALERPASTISREIKHNTCARRGYASRTAQAMARQRRVQAKADAPVAAQPAGADDAQSWKWSPQQISATLKRMHPDDPSARLAHEMVYNTLYAFSRAPTSRCIPRRTSMALPTAPTAGSARLSTGSARCTSTRKCSPATIPLITLPSSSVRGVALQV
jgi:IS30 family transposase